MRKRIISLVLLMAVSGTAFAFGNAKDVHAATLPNATKIEARNVKTSRGFATVRRGSRGSDVSQLQRLLNYEAGAYGHSSWRAGSEDGIFGASTERAVRAFQRDNGLSVDGICGPRTWDKLWDKVS